MDCMKKAQDAQLRILAMQDRLVDPPVILREADIAHRTYCFHGQDLIYSSGRAVLPTPIRP